ncbi:MAG TPA: hypothetical protein VJT54_18025, partial [Verrucomicrobiae bacterium]|nr:hypothetical protein [Verrucomicrobiae bacterium]
VAGPTSKCPACNTSFTGRGITTGLAGGDGERVSTGRNRAHPTMTPAAANAIPATKNVRTVRFAQGSLKRLGGCIVTPLYPIRTGPWSQVI